MLSSNLRKSKIPILWGEGIHGIWCWVQICKNPKFPFCLGWGGVSWNLMLSSNLLKSKIPILGGGGCWWNQISTLDAESKFAIKKIFANNFLSFRAKMCLGMVFDFEYQVVRICEPQLKYRSLLFSIHILCGACFQKILPCTQQGVGAPSLVADQPLCNS